MVLIHKEIKKDVYKNIVLKNYNNVLIFWKLQSLDFKALHKHAARFLRIINNKKNGIHPQLVTCYILCINDFLMDFFLFLPSLIASL